MYVTRVHLMTVTFKIFGKVLNDRVNFYRMLINLGGAIDTGLLFLVDVQKTSVGVSGSLLY